MGGAQRLAVVTGANSGIGLEITAGLREQGFEVVMACRSMERCAAAKAELDGRGLPGSCECASLDLSDLASVRAFASSLERKGRSVSVLENNAGIMGVGPGPDGTNAHMLPNHFGPFLLTRLLLPLMAAHGRIVTVGSEAHRRVLVGAAKSPAAAAANLERSANWFGDYAHSKLANLLMTAELSRQLQARGSTVTAYCVSPGRVNTNIFAGVPGLLRAPLQFLAGLVFQTPKEGARTALKAALAPELQGKHVLYMHDSREAQPAAAAKDAGLAGELWRRSLLAVGLSRNDDARLWPEV